MKTLLSKPSEKEFEKTVIKILELNKYVAMRVNTLKSGHYKSYRIPSRGTSGSEGFPDIIAFKAPDRFIVIETKVGRNGLTPSQVLFRDWWQSRGFAYHTAKNIDELLNILRGEK